MLGGTNAPFRRHILIKTTSATTSGAYCMDFSALHSGLLWECINVRSSQQGKNKSQCALFCLWMPSFCCSLVLWVCSWWFLFLGYGRVPGMQTTHVSSQLHLSLCPPPTVFVFLCSIVDPALWIQDLISCCRSPQEQALPKNIAMQQLVGKRAEKGELYVEQLSSVAVQVSVCTCVCVCVCVCVAI